MAQAHSYSLFATAIGTCAVAWNDVGLTGIWLPAAEGTDLRRQVLRRTPHARAATPVGDGHVVEAIPPVAGERVDFRRVCSISPTSIRSDRSVYVARARARPRRHVRRSRGARRRWRDGARGASARPHRWHRRAPPWVVASGDGLGGFSAPGGTATKRRRWRSKAHAAAARPTFSMRPSPRSRIQRQDARPAFGTDAARPSSTGVLIDPSGRS
jgi:methylated-DNA-[protein]-cysteine S-methyltransferase